MTWYLIINNKQVGPMSETDVQDRLKRGEINPQTFAWTEGLPGWAMLGSPQLMAGKSPQYMTPPALPINGMASNEPSGNRNILDYYLGAFKKYATFAGRARRSEYWYFSLMNMIVSFAIGFVMAFVGVPALSGLYSLFAFLPAIAVSVRRAHDVNRSGWFLLIPIYGIIMMFMKGTEGPNKFGDDPKGSGPNNNQHNNKVEPQFSKAA